MEARRADHRGAGDARTVKSKPIAQLGSMSSPLQGEERSALRAAHQLRRLPNGTLSNLQLN